MAGETVSGRCLCGAVSFTVTLANDEMQVCHCEMCRRWTAGVLMCAAVVPSSVTLANEDAMGVFASSERGERCFCRTCGSSLFWRSRDGRQVDVSAQAIDNPSRLRFTTEIFVDDKPDNYDFANLTVKKTGAEAMAADRQHEGSNG